MDNERKKWHPDVWRTEAALALCERFNRLIPDESYTLGEALADIDEIIAKAPLPPPGEQNAPLQVPQGYRLVPLEPTPEMQAVGAQAIRFDTTPINKLWTGNAVYRAMLAAAPKE